MHVKTVYLMSGASHDGGEHGTRSVVSCKASFAHTRSIVNNEGGNIVIHFLHGEERRELSHM